MNEATIAKTIAKLRFSRALRVADREWNDARDEPIVYRIRAWRPDGRGPLPIARAGGTDAEGILDIGESEYGCTRLNAFATVAIEERRTSHRAGYEYSTTWGYSFGSLFPSAHLRVDVLTLPSKHHAEAIELALLEWYRWTYKDRPPLNSSGGKWRKVEHWLRKQGHEPRIDGWLNIDGIIGGSPGKLRPRAGGH